MPFEPGRIILVSFPFTDHTSAKLRPALVVSGSAFNAAEDFVAVPISGQLDADGYQILSTDPYFKTTQLRGDSTVRWMKPMTISSKVVVRRLGTIPPEVLTQIQAHIRSFFS